MSNDDLTTKLAEALRRIADRCPTYSNEYKVASVGDIAREALRLYDAAKAQPKQAAEPAILNCEIQPRPLSHPLADYHHAMSEGPLHYTWQDKPHRLVYDLIAAVRYYAAPVAQEAQRSCSEPRKPLTHTQIDAIWNSVEWSPRLHIEITRAIEAAHNIKEQP